MGNEKNAFALQGNNIFLMNSLEERKQNETLRFQLRSRFSVNNLP